jgi:hypothetical protein
MWYIGMQKACEATELYWLGFQHELGAVQEIYAALTGLLQLRLGMQL